MALVGEFPGLSSLKRQTVRGPVNPLDKSTIVSIYPKDINEVKYTLTPGTFHIFPGSYENPSLLVVGPSSWWREIDEEQPLLEIPVSSIQIADSVVKDYCNGVLGCNMSDSMPGLFYVPGEHTVQTLHKSFQHELDKSNTRQRSFYSVMIKMADALWARSNGNPLAISDDMRLAANELNQKAKDWMKDYQMVDMVRCLACGALKNPTYPVCGQCRAIDQNHPRAKEIKFAS
jgi:hypothetical protein